MLGGLGTADIFAYGSVTLAFGSRNAALRAAQWAFDAGKQVIFDVNLRPAIWPDLEEARTQIGEALATATVVKLNETELALLTGTDDPIAGSQQLLEQGLQLVCVSLRREARFLTTAVFTAPFLLLRSMCVIQPVVAMRLLLGLPIS